MLYSKIRQDSFPPDSSVPSRGRSDSSEPSFSGPDSDHTTGKAEVPWERYVHGRVKVLTMADKGQDLGPRGLGR